MSAALTTIPDRQPDHQYAVPPNALIPENMDQAMRLATAMANAKLVPQHLQGDVGSCLMIVEQAMRWRASPFAVAQCTSSIGGSLCYEGKLIAAILPACGAIIGELNYEYEGDPKKPETLSVTVTGRRASDGEIKTLKLAWIDAKTKNQYWNSQPEQQLCYAGARVWARRWTPGPMLGIYAPEEFDRSTGRVKEDFAGQTIEGEAEAEKPRAAATAMPRAPTVRAPAEPVRPTVRHSIAPPAGAPDEAWRACLDKVAPAMHKLSRLALIQEMGDGPTCSDIVANGPEWAKAELAQIIADNCKRLAPPPDASDAGSDPTFEELGEVVIPGEAKLAAG